VHPKYLSHFHDHFFLYLNLYSVLFPLPLLTPTPTNPGGKASGNRRSRKFDGKTFLASQVFSWWVLHSHYPPTPLGRLQASARGRPHIERRTQYKKGSITIQVTPLLSEGKGNGENESHPKRTEITKYY